jgi:hypothetical protein
MPIFALVRLGLALALCFGVSQSFCFKEWLPTLYREIGNWEIDWIHKLHVFCDFILIMSFLFNPSLLLIEVCLLIGHS